MATKGEHTAPRVEVTCAGCGAVQERLASQVRKNTSGRFFCSEKCRDEVGSKPRTGARLTCEWCSGPFYRRPGKAGRARFCSAACREANRGAGRESRECKACGKTFLVSQAKIRLREGLYCSSICRHGGKQGEHLDRTFNGKPVKLLGGYAMVYVPGEPGAYNHGWMPEHRYVMQRVLGRPLVGDENVHHISGDKLDNRPENLELWITKQPKGQRAPDVAALARRQLSLYGTDYERSLFAESSPLHGTEHDQGRPVSAVLTQAYEYLALYGTPEEQAMARRALDLPT